MGKHGKSDWGLQLKSIVYTLDDLSELAVRLGSPVFFDRRGDVLLIDSFENGLGGWYVHGSGDGNEQLVTSEIVRSGGYSAKLVAGSTNPWYSYMQRAFPYPVLSKWGFEVHLCFTDNIDKIRFWFIQDEVTASYAGVIQYDAANKKLQYMDSLDHYTDIVSSFEFLERNNLFHAMKLVVDLEAHKYHRLIVNETTHDLSDYALVEGGSLGYKFCEVRIYLYSRNKHNDYVYIDNVIVTQNEP